MSWNILSDTTFTGVTGQSIYAVLLIMLGVVLRSLFVGAKIKKLKKELHEFRKIEHELRDVYQQLQRQQLLNPNVPGKEDAPGQTSVLNNTKPRDE